MTAVTLGIWLIWIIALILVSAVVHLISRQKLLQERQAGHVRLSEATNELVRIQTEANNLQQINQNNETELSHCRQELQLVHKRLSAAEAVNTQLINVQETLQHERQQYRLASEQYQAISTKLAAAEQQLQDWLLRSEEWRLREEEYTQVQAELNHARVENSRLATQLQHEREAYEEKLTLLNEARASLSDQFKSLANDILEEKSKRFSEQNQASLSQLLNPLHERMQGFSQLVQNTYEKEAKERTTLETELKHLQQLNAQLHSDAKALTDALSGTQNKNQGNWGEMILEKVLENSGLHKGREYVLQASSTVIDEFGRQRRLQPDVLVNLPENKQIVIDAKTSLTAYVRYTQATDASSADKALAAHIQSVRQHIKELSAKCYDEIDGLNTLDFVFMFIPVEPAYLLALQQDNQLFDDCFQKRIMLVGPSTLLATLRTIAHIWRSEQQNQNALIIAKEGGKLYDKFVGFVNTLEGVGKNLDQAQGQFQKAMGQLVSGRGNLVSKANKLRQLGVQSSKNLPENYQCLEEDEEELPVATTDSL
ncbi:DNA recombination protein RmuC [Snodgrassella alvi]|uniref:DNA recombination protein RmuC n=1 Tax=Snodgrassella alvi TaxID=1196083 RepID=UPI000C1E46D1|nr:DNA recombination protein RmuC [Snodgrassella alvi]PIT13331.1 recombinase RmuC [Snodgrassella alvi]PIT18848.1 recombinase RmuC [Snodgrassella alvi]